MQYRHNRKPRGHTLVEMMIGIAVVTVWIVCLGGMGYIGWLAIQALKKYIGA